MGRDLARASLSNRPIPNLRIAPDDYSRSNLCRGGDAGFHYAMVQLEGSIRERDEAETGNSLVPSEKTSPYPNLTPTTYSSLDGACYEQG